MLEDIGGGRGGADGFFLLANARHSKPKVASRCRHAANLAYDLFNIFLYVIARKVRKYLLSPFVTSNVVLSCHCANGRHFGATCTKGRQPVCFTIDWRTLLLFVKHTYPPPPVSAPPPPPPPPTFWTAPPPLEGCVIKLTANNTPANIELQRLLALLVCGFQSCSCFACEFLAYM